MKLLAIGRLKAGAEYDLLTRYCARLRPKLDIIEFPQIKKSPAEQKRKEAELLLGACPANAFIVVLDEGGRSLDSFSFSHYYQQWQESGRPVYFIIGGAEGLEASVLSRADIVLSFGKMTWPHMLVRILLAEQLFRAQAILSGHPYHRADRPE